MLGRVPALAAAGVATAPRPARPEPRLREGHALLFDPGGPRWPNDAAEPGRRPVSPQATFWSWAAVALLIAALVLPFSLAALVDLVSYLTR